jgi:cytochrome c oxidase subunit 3
MSKDHHAHHFDSAEAEFEASKFGIWVFLCTEILMFGGLFVGYILAAGKYPEIFEAGSQFLDWKLGAINTAVLLLSSYTIAISIRNIQTGEPKKAIKNMIITLLCGFAFMGIKGYEYNHKFHLGLYPGKFFNYQPEGAHHASKDSVDHSKNLKVSAAEAEAEDKAPGDHRKPELIQELPENIAMYFSFYFLMTGIHGTHVLIGMGLIFWCLIRARRDEFTPEYYTALEGAALFWHLVDLVWIYLFPLLYLI